MLFLDFNLFKPSTWLSGAPDGIMGALLSGLRTLLFNITCIVYELMVNVYNLFEKLCGARILDNDVIGMMAKRIGVVLGLVMLFYIIFSLIQMLINPDKMEDKEKGAVQIVKKVLLVVVMLGVSTFCFEAAFGFQKKIMESNIIEKFLLPYNIEGLEENKFGNLLSVNLLNSFYKINADIENGSITLSGGQSSNNYDDCKGYIRLFSNQIYRDNRYDLGYICLNASVDVKRVNADGIEIDDQVYVVDYNGIIAVLVGAFTVYLMLMYCFKIGVRMIQLAFLEIISPMAIISYLAPKKDNMLSKWWKIYFSTYIDVFIRIAIINLVIFLICTIYSNDTAGGNLLFWETVGAEGAGEKTFFTVVIVLALLTFAKKAPDLIKEIIGSSASKLGFGAAMKDIVGLEKVGKWAPKAATGIVGGALGGAAIGLLGGGPGGFAGGLLKGGLSGLKGQGFTKTWAKAWKDRSKTNADMAKLRANGGDWFGYKLAKLQHGLGIETQYEQLEREYSSANDYVNNFSSAKKKADGEVDKFASNYKFKDAAGNVFTLKELDKMRNDDTRYDEHQRALFDDVYNKIHGFARDQALLNNGAVKTGEMVWEDAYGGNWADIEKYVNTTGVTATANNVEIEAYMNNILASREASNASGNRFEKAKKANDAYEKQIRNKINDGKYKSAKANDGK